jgi:hypothetical protein
MREVEDRSYAEIAEVLGVTVPAVEALLFRARGNLRERRKALAGALSVAPVPSSLGSFVGGGGSLTRVRRNRSRLAAGTQSRCAMSQRASSSGAWVSRRSALSLRLTRRRHSSSSSKVRNSSLPQTSYGGPESGEALCGRLGLRAPVAGRLGEAARSAARPPTTPPRSGRPRGRSARGRGRPPFRRPRPRRRTVSAAFVAAVPTGTRSADGARSADGDGSADRTDRPRLP